jgi:translation initiation factor IF-3
LKRGRRKPRAQADKTRVNNGIRARSLRVLGPEGENFGELSLKEARDKAEELQLDLIEISPNANPPVAKIMDYGQYQYEKKRKAAEVKSKSHVTETKSVQVKIGTGENDQMIKAKRAAEWLNEGHRVKVDLFLWGRYKYMESDFLKERLERFVKTIPSDYKIADPIKKSPKGWTMTLERLGKSVKGPRVIEEEAKKKPEVEDGAAKAPVAQKKKKSLDELLEGGMV